MGGGAMNFIYSLKKLSKILMPIFPCLPAKKGCSTKKMIFPDFSCLLLVTKSKFKRLFTQNTSIMKRKQFQLIGIFAILNLVLSSCWFLGPSVRGNGNVTEEVRQVGDFDQIDVSRGMNVYITQGTPQKVVVIADNNLHEVIETRVEGQTLKIFVNENVRWAKEKKVMVTVEKLTSVKTSSGSNAWSQNQIMSEDLELRASSGANLTMEVNAKSLNADCSSGANIKLSGLAKEAELEASSGANLIGDELKVDNCRMKTSSGANVSATVNERLDAHASSGGNVVYYGEPKSTEVSTSSGGNIRKK